MDITVTWRGLVEHDLDDLGALAGRCLADDDGLPLAAGASFLRGRFLAAGASAQVATAADGRLVAAVTVRPQDTDGVRRVAVYGLVDPAYRRRGLGGALLDRGLADAARLAGGQVVVETESLTEPAAALFADRGLVRFFAEDVLRFDLAETGPPRIVLPEGVRPVEWSAAVAARFFATYAASFADRPGFPGWSADRWIEWTAGDEDFRPDWSLLATTTDGEDVGFVTAADGWIVQVGVRPAWRGRGVGAGLVAEVLSRMRAAGGTEALLTVNLDNAAGTLYRRLGFVGVGRRARYARPAPGTA